MNSPSRSKRPTRLRIVAAAVLAACASGFLSGCSGLIADHLPAAVGGLPADTPERPTSTGQYPAVHNMPPARSTATLDNDQQKQLEDDLVAARNRYGGNPDAPTAATAGTTAPAGGKTANASAGNAGNP